MGQGIVMGEQYSSSAGTILPTYFIFLPLSCPNARPLQVERVRFSKDGSALQLTAVDGRRAGVVLPNDPELVDILARNGVDISVSEGDQQGNYVALLGNILFPLIAFGGLFFLFRRAQGGEGGEQTGRATLGVIH
jgi:cell division protease FtsH